MSAPIPHFVEIERQVKARELSIDEFCQRVGIHRATWQRYKVGKTSPTLKIIGKIDEVLAEVEAS